MADSNDGTDKASLKHSQPIKPDNFGHVHASFLCGTQLYSSAHGPQLLQFFWVCVTPLYHCKNSARLQDLQLHQCLQLCRSTMYD